MPHPAQGPDPRPSNATPTGSPRRSAVDSRAHTADTRSGPSRSEKTQRLHQGDLVADRYRIVTFLGKGGMGEVYRADDLELGQSVALKLLPSRISADPVLADRVRAEVRLARRVTHRNVCRIHDVARLPAEQGADLFITMEYVDGEDLSTLLRRIGKLPQDKAVDVARQLCAALSAAHEQGVIHRDLKPANIMLDGRGAVRLTDFGIAAIADEVSDKDASSGTPAYMAPEQFEGREVSPRSDIYSLGLVLYELLTGKPAWNADSFAQLKTIRETTGTRPSLSTTNHGDIDPALAALVDRCLEHDPVDRPASALAVAAALPGADPLAAALAAGETPSPELIAASGGRGLLAPRIALAILASVIIAAAAGLLLAGPRSLTSLAGPPPPPAVMREEAHDVLRALGYDIEPGTPSKHGWTVSALSINRVTEAVRTGEADWSAFDQGINAPIRYWLRLEPRGFEPGHPANAVEPDVPVRAAPGSTYIQLDQNRKLREFSRRPPTNIENPSDAEPDWSVAFTLAGLDINDFTPVDERRNAGTDATIRRAWAGPIPGGPIHTPDQILKVFLGATEGRVSELSIVVSPRVDAPHATPDAEPIPAEAIPAQAALSETAPPEPAASAPDLARVQAALQAAARWIIIGSITLVAGVLAYRNIRLRRSDTRRATRLAIAVFLLTAASSILDADILPARLTNLIGPFPIYASGIGIALIAAACYIAIEPIARSRWPGSLVSWTRLFSGNFRDPMIGRDLLVGAAVGAAMVALTALSPFISAALDIPPTRPSPIGLQPALEGPRHALANAIAQFSSSLLNAAAVALLVLLTMVVLQAVRIRQRWPAVLIVSLLIVSQQFAQIDLNPVDRVTAAVGNVLIILLIARVGLLATAAALVAATLLAQTAAAAPFDQWWAPAALTPAAILLALLLYAYRIATAGRSIFA